VVHFCAALTANPFCWSAFEELCSLGEEARAQAILASAECVLSRHLLSCKAEARLSASALYPSGDVELQQQDEDATMLSTPVTLPPMLSPRAVR